MSQNQNGKIDHFHRELPPQDDTDEEVYAVAEESVKFLEESHKETSKVLKELQSDWASQGSDSIIPKSHNVVVKISLLHTCTLNFDFDFWSP